MNISINIIEIKDSGLIYVPVNSMLLHNFIFYFMGTTGEVMLNNLALKKHTVRHSYSNVTKISCCHVLVNKEARFIWDIYYTVEERLSFNVGRYSRP